MKKATKQINIRISELDYKIIERKAELSGMSVSEYIRTCACNKQVKGFKKSDIDNPDSDIPGQQNIDEYLQ